jgi:hypothetical protein
MSFAFDLTSSIFYKMRAGAVRLAKSGWTWRSLKFLAPAFVAAALMVSFSSGPSRLGNAGPGSWPFVEEHMLRLQDVLERAVGGDKGYIIGNIAFHPLQVRCRMGEGWCGVRRREMLNPDLCGFTHPPTWRSLDAPHPTA